MPGSQYASGTGMKRGAGPLSTKASGAETATATHNALDTGQSGMVYVEVVVSAVSGTTPTMTVVVEGSDDGTNFFTLGTIGANGYSVGTTASAPSNINATGTYRAAFPAPQLVRSRSVIGGTTPSFTYAVNVAPN